MSPRKNIEFIYKLSQKFIENFDNSDEKNLLFTGNTGLGKSFLSSCIANELLKKGKTVLYQTAPVMLDTIMDYRFGKANTSKDIYDTYNYLINTSNYSVYVVGDVEEDKLIDNLKYLNFPINKCFEYEIASEEEYKIDKVKEINEIQNINQSILCMGYRNDFNINHPKYYQSLVFCEMFGGGYISDLFRVVREDNSLAYSIVSQMISDVKLMVIDAGIDKDKYHDVINIINEILENYKKGIIDEELLEISKISLISGIEETEDSAGAYIAYMLRNYLANEDLTLEEAINKIAATTKEDIIEIAKGIHLDTIVLLSN